MSKRYAAEIDYVKGTYMIDLTDALYDLDHPDADQAYVVIRITKNLLATRADMARDIAYIAKYSALAVSEPGSLTSATFTSVHATYVRHDTAARIWREALDLAILPLQRKAIGR
jgi:hypothetical protein